MRRLLEFSILFVLPWMAIACLWIVENRNLAWRSEVVLRTMRENWSWKEKDDVELEAKDADHFIGNGRIADGRVVDVRVTTGNGRVEAYIGEGFLSCPLAWTRIHSRSIQLGRLYVIALFSYLSVWTLLGLFGLRKKYSPRMERLLYACTVLNMANVALQVQQFVTRSLLD
jgi:hypothetical protein